MNRLLLTDDSVQLSNEFFIMLERLADALRVYGITCYARSKEPLFFNLSVDEQKRAFNYLKSYMDILQSCHLRPNEANFDQKFIWSAFRSLDLIPNDDIWKYYFDGCVVEFYDMTGVQRFRNFNFFDICSYTLEDIFTKPWFSLYERDESITAAIVESSTKLFTKEIEYSIPTLVPDHDLIEKKSERQNYIRMHLDRFIPLKVKSSNYVMVVVIEKCEVIRSLKQQGQTQFRKQLELGISPIS